MKARILIVFVLVAGSSIHNNGEPIFALTPESQISANTFGAINNGKTVVVKSVSIQHWRS